MEFLPLSRRRSSARNGPAAKSEEKRMFSQANKKQYGGRFVRHLVYHRIEESWYRKLSQINRSALVHVLILMLVRY